MPLMKVHPRQFVSNTIEQLTERSWYKIVPGALPVTRDEYDSLWHAHPPQQDPVTLFGKTHLMPRYQRLYGDNISYRYSGETVQSCQIDHPVLARALSSTRELEPDFDFNGILVNWYQDGAHYMGAHADDERDLAPGAPIYSYTLGATRVFRIRNKHSSERIDLLLDDGMLLVMGGDFQHEFKHELPKAASVRGSRINLTVRALLTGAAGR